MKNDKVFDKMVDNILNDIDNKVDIKNINVSVRKLASYLRLDKNADAISICNPIDIEYVDSLEHLKEILNVCKNILSFYDCSKNSYNIVLDYCRVIIKSTKYNATAFIK